MGMGFAPTWLRQVSPPLHKTTLTTGKQASPWSKKTWHNFLERSSARYKLICCC